MSRFPNQPKPGEAARAARHRKYLRGLDRADSWWHAKRTHARHRQGLDLTEPEWPDETDPRDETDGLWP